MAKQFVANIPGVASKDSPGVALQINLPQTVLAGDLVVIGMAFDNTGFSTPDMINVGKPQGENNTWKIHHHSSASGSGSGVRGALMYIKATIDWTSLNAVVLPTTEGIAAKAAAGYIYRGVDDVLVGSAQISANASSGAMVTVPNVDPLNILFAMASVEDSGVPTASMSTIFWEHGSNASTSGKGASSNIGVSVHVMPEPTAGNHNFGPSFPAGDCGVIAVQLRGTPAGPGPTPGPASAFAGFGIPL